MKVVINNDYGGFSLSYEGVKRYAELCGFNVYPFVTDFSTHTSTPWDTKGEEPLFLSYSKTPLIDGKHNNEDYFSERNIERDDPNLVKVVEELGEKANGRCASLTIVEIPDGIKWQIEEYDGSEWISEKHRTWGR